MNARARTRPPGRSAHHRFISKILESLRSAAGAFDLPSILVGVVVVGILTAGVLGSIFGIIPFAQDNAARQDAAAARTAEGVAKAKDGRYMDTSELIAAGYLSQPKASAEGGTPGDGGFERASSVVPMLHYAAGVDAAKACFLILSRSESGAVFYTSNQVTDPAPYTPGMTTGCLAPAIAQSMADSLAGVVPSMAVASFGLYGAGDTSSTSPAVVAGLAGSITSLSTNNYASCAVSDGKAYCWGVNWGGQLGNGSTTGTTTPTAVDTSGALAGKTVTKVAIGDNHVCAVADGAAYCWGLGASGGLGNGSMSDSRIPVAVTVSGVLSGKTVTDVAVGSNFSCAIADGSVYCWGKDNVSQLGDGLGTDSSVPVAVQGLPAGATAIASTIQGACAVADGKAYCWGQGSSLGNGSSFSRSVVAVDMAGAMAGKTIASIAGQNDDFCATTTDGGAYCWGNNYYGQLGDGTTAVSVRPVAVALSGHKVSSVSVGNVQACAMTDDGVFCWGSNSFGQLGDGSTGDSHSPVAVDTTGVLSGKKALVIATGSGGSLVAYI